MIQHAYYNKYKADKPALHLYVERDKVGCLPSRRTRAFPRGPHPSLTYQLGACSGILPFLRASVQRMAQKALRQSKTANLGVLHMIITYLLLVLGTKQT